MSCPGSDIYPIKFEPLHMCTELKLGEDCSVLHAFQSIWCMKIIKAYYVL